MDIVERARSIIINPGPTWQVIEQEPAANPQALYVPYMVLLAAIPAVATFIGMSLVGVGFGWRLPIVTGLSIMISQYVMSLVAVFVWAWLVNVLAGNFGAQANLMNALKLTVYGSTPSMVAGALYVIPGLGTLAGIVGLLYGLYVMYLGLPVLMKNPPDKTVPYMAVVVVVGIVCMVVIASISSIFMRSPLGRMGMMSDASNGISISTPRGEVTLSATPGAATAQSGNAAVTIKTPDGEVKLDAKNMEEFAKRMEAMASAAAVAAEKSSKQ